MSKVKELWVLGTELRQHAERIGGHLGEAQGHRRLANAHREAGNHGAALIFDLLELRKRAHMAREGYHAAKKVRHHFRRTA